MTEPPRIWKTGERCRVTFHGRTVDAAMIIASPNGWSLGLQFEALLGGYAGAMPLMWDGERSFRDLVTGYPVTLEEHVQQAPTTDR